MSVEPSSGSTIAPTPVPLPSFAISSGSLSGFQALQNLDSSLSETEKAERLEFLKRDRERIQKIVADKLARRQAEGTESQMSTSMMMTSSFMLDRSVQEPPAPIPPPRSQTPPPVLRASSAVRSTPPLPPSPAPQPEVRVSIGPLPAQADSAALRRVHSRASSLGDANTMRVGLRIMSPMGDDPLDLGIRINLVRVGRVLKPFGFAGGVLGAGYFIFATETNRLGTHPWYTFLSVVLCVTAVFLIVITQPQEQIRRQPELPV